MNETNERPCQTKKPSLKKKIKVNKIKFKKNQTNKAHKVISTERMMPEAFLCVPVPAHTCAPAPAHTCAPAPTHTCPCTCTHVCSRICTHRIKDVAQSVEWFSGMNKPLVSISSTTHMYVVTETRSLSIQEGQGSGHPCLQNEFRTRHVTLSQEKKKRIHKKEKEKTKPICVHTHTPTFSFSSI